MIVSLVGPLSLSYQLMSASGVLNAVVVLSCGLACAWQQVPGARLLTLAWFALLAGAVLMALRNFGILSTNVITANGMLVGSALEMLLLSFGLAARFNELKRQKVQAQAETLAMQQQSLHVSREHERLLELRVAERTAQLEAANARLSDLALHDPLTGLANRSALDVHLLNALSHDRGASGDQPLQLLMIDLDGFKPVNDHHGHAVGDRLLKQIAQRIRSCVRGGDLAARLGGDEFIVVCGHATSDDDVRMLCERVRAAIAAPLAFEGGVMRITASIGVATAGPGRIDERELLMRADRAMYQAKAAGGDCVQWFGENPGQINFSR